MQSSRHPAKKPLRQPYLYGLQETAMKRPSLLELLEGF